MWFEDGCAEGSPDFPIVGRRWYETLGYFTPEMFEHWCTEKWLFDLGGRIGRLNPIDGYLVVHFTYERYEAPLDDTYLRNWIEPGNKGLQKVDRDFRLFDQTEMERKRTAAALESKMSVLPAHPDLKEPST